jgi:hypothetical protein
VSEVRTEFREETAEPRGASLPLSHVSVELGHLYMEDLAAGPDAIAAMFAAVAPWAAAAQSPAAAGCARKAVRASTCFLVDDYFSRFSTPAQVIPMLEAAAAAAGLRIDYLARESACARTPDGSPAELTLARLVTEPVPGTTGSRPPLTETGWLTNGARSPATARGEAMARRSPWQPPLESARRRHSIFVDVELWDERDDRTWSCAMLAAVWQLIRLGLLRDHGQPVLTPRDWAGPLPTSWDELPPVTRLRPGAPAFAAYTTFSALSPPFLPVELAVRTILSQFAGEAPVLAEVRSRAVRDGMLLPDRLTDRIRYVFAGPVSPGPA